MLKVFFSNQRNMVDIITLFALLHWRMRAFLLSIIVLRISPLRVARLITKITNHYSKQNNSQYIYIYVCAAGFLLKSKKYF